MWPPNSCLIAEIVLFPRENFLDLSFLIFTATSNAGAYPFTAFFVCCNSFIVTEPMSVEMFLKSGLFSAFVVKFNSQLETTDESCHPRVACLGSILCSNFDNNSTPSARP